MKSFLSKFSLLATCGLNANLTFDSSGSSITVNLKANLGYVNAFMATKSCKNSGSSKPSRIRRRQRRKAERAFCAQNDILSKEDLYQSCEEFLVDPTETDLAPLSFTSPALPDVHCQTMTNSSQPLQPDTSLMTDSATLLKPELSLEKLNPIGIAPKKPNLSIVTQPSISVPPKKIYHSAIIKACYAITGKDHPSQLLPEEVKKFKAYIDHKREIGEPVESDLLYLPTSMRDCIHCGYPT